MLSALPRVRQDSTMHTGQGLSFDYFSGRGDIGRWIAFIAVVIRLFFASQFPQTIHGKSLVIEL